MRSVAGYPAWMPFGRRRYIRHTLQGAISSMAETKSHIVLKLTPREAEAVRFLLSYAIEDASEEANRDIEIDATRVLKKLATEVAAQDVEP